VKRWKFSQEKLEVVPKGKSLDKIYKFNQVKGCVKKKRFSQEELKVVPKKKKRLRNIGLVKKS
jgi:hypothetical protein